MVMNVERQLNSTWRIASWENLTQRRSVPHGTSYRESFELFTRPVFGTPLPHEKRGMNSPSDLLTHENSIVDSRNILLFTDSLDKRIP